MQTPTGIESVASQHQIFAEKPAEGVAACFILPHPSSHTATALSSQLQPAQLSKQPHLLLLFTYFSGGSTPTTASLPDGTVNRQRGDGMDKTGDGHWEGGAYLCFTSTEALGLSRHKGRQVPSGPKGAA